MRPSLSWLQHSPAETPAHRTPRTRALPRRVPVFLDPDRVPVRLAHPPRAPLVRPEVLRVAPVPKVGPNPQPHQLARPKHRVLRHHLDEVHVRFRHVLPTRVLVFIPVTEEHPAGGPRDHELVGARIAQRVSHLGLLGVVPLPVHATRAREVVAHVKVAFSREMLHTRRCPGPTQAGTLARSALGGEERRSARADGDG